MNVNTLISLDGSGGSEPAGSWISASGLAALVEEHVARLAYTLRPDYLAALEAAALVEESERGREVLGQLLENARIAAADELPLCQDTGYVWVCLEVSGSLCVPADIFSQVDEAVARASALGGLRMSILEDALVERINTKDNTPALCEVVFKRESVEKRDETNASSGESAAACAPAATLHIMLKGGGSDNASALAMLPPGAGIEGVMNFVVEALAAKGANACPPLVVGVGVGGSFDRVAGLAKHALLRKIGSTKTNAQLSEIETQLLARINALGIGPGGLGGSTTALAVHIESAPCHIAALPVAVNIGCNSLRSISIPLL